MINNIFFKPTMLCKEFVILDLIGSNNNVTQRDIARHLGISVSMVNEYLSEFEKSKMIKIQYISKKKLIYSLTAKGFNRKMYLNIEYFNSTQKLYNIAKSNISQVLSQLVNKGFTNVVLYGAGNVAEIFLNTIISADIKINIAAIIDDDVNKQGKSLQHYQISKLSSLDNLKYDKVLIASYNNKKIMKENLINSKVDGEKIIDFFNILNGEKI